MSIHRVCPNCFRKERFRFNFGDNSEAEMKFHDEKWCDCGYNSPEEMMKDQDMGFDDPLWIPISKYLLENYHRGLREANIFNREHQVRFFLKLLKSAANNCYKSLDIVELKEGEKFESIQDGKPKQKPTFDIFKNDYVG